NLGKIRKLKDSQNRPLWEPSYQVGSPDTLLGYPVVTDPNVAAFSTAAATAHPIAFGSFTRGYAYRSMALRFEASRDFAFDKDLVTYRVLARIDGRAIDLN